MREQIVLRIVSKMVIPYILVFGFYVITHGERGPGGGFQGGVILASAYILYCLIFGLEAGRRVLPPRLLDVLVAIGLFAYAMVGWFGILGAEAGNLALRALSIGGVFLGGGIVVKLIEKLREPAFVEAYVAKGALGDLVRKIPVRVVLDDRAALFGAARLAFEIKQHSPA